jgi:membrane-associated phospholipid phosphatase
MRSDIHVPAQPGSPEEAPRILPLKALLLYILTGALFCVLATLAFVWLAAGVLVNRFIMFDERTILWMHNHWGSVLDQVMLFFTSLGDTLVLTAMLGWAALALLRRGRWIDAAGLVLAGAGAGIINQVLKALYQRVRPDLFTGPFNLTSYSFPSGHSMGAIACYGMLAFVAIRLLRRPAHRIAVVLAAVLVVLGVGCSRVYFGVHFPTDVLGGFIAGLIWLVVSIGLVRAAEWYAVRRGAIR